MNNEEVTVTLNITGESSWKGIILALATNGYRVWEVPTDDPIGITHTIKFSLDETNIEGVN